MVDYNFPFLGGIFKFITSSLIRFFSYFFTRRKTPKKWKELGCILNTTTSKDKVIFTCQNGFLEIAILTPQIWRIRALSNKPSNKIHSWALQKLDIKKPSIIVEEKDDYFFIKAILNEAFNHKNGLHFVIKKSAGTITTLRGKDILHTEQHAASFQSSWVHCQKLAGAKEFQLGFGEKTGPLFKNGQKLIFWNFDPTSYRTADDPIYQSTPIQISVRKDGSAHGIFYDNHHYSRVNIDQELQGKTDYYAERGSLCYYLFAGPTVKEIVKQISLLTGTLPLPPRWILGYHQCRWSYPSATRVREIAQLFRQKKIPCDVIHLDIDYMEGYRCFTWSKERFPKPAALLKELREEGFKTICIIDPGLKVDPDWEIYQEVIANNFHCKKKNGKDYIGKVWPGNCVFPDFTHPEVRDWWAQKFSSLYSVGIESVWLDMNEPSLFSLRRTMPNDVQHNMNGQLGDHNDAHNIYGQAMAQAARLGAKKLRPDKRTYLFTRSCYAGIQQYAGSWTGDNFSRWSGLQQSIPMLLNLGLSGQIMTGPDIGGFDGDCSSELFIRWLQLGIWYPFCRNHTAAGTRNQEPWAYDQRTETIARKYIQLRYKFLPYLYTLLKEGCTTGLPIMRPLFMEEPNDLNCYEEKWLSTEFFVGRNILVAPILTKGKNGKVKKEIYLPKGSWIDFWTNEEIQGGRIITRVAKLDYLPFFIRKGSVIPLANLIEYSEQTISHPLILKVYPAAKIFGKIYLDDGISKDYLEDEYCYLTIVGSYSPNAKKKLTITIKNQGFTDQLLGFNNKLRILFSFKLEPKKITFNEKDFRLPLEDKKIMSSWHQKKGILEILIDSPSFPIEMLISF
jgi:alpha-glucosidase